MPFIKNLGTLGIEATLRVVDPVQFRARLDDFDFDITVQRFGFSTLPGALLRTYFSSRAAASKGSQNLAGISDPLIDLLIEKVVAADSRPALVTACKVLDRVVRNGRYWVPHWARIGSRIGTCSGGRRQSRATRAESRKPGGMIVKRRRKYRLCTPPGARAFEAPRKKTH
jgi:microcin C transport system substrate-binding protein